MDDSTLGLVSVADIKKAINLLTDDAQLSFEYMVASFYPKAYENMQSLLKDAYTQGYIQAQNELKGDKE